MADPLGHSLLLADGDLVFSDDGALVETHGRQNLIQALVLRVLTPLGSDPFATGYGLDVQHAFTQPAATHVVKELIKLNLVRTLNTDPRVSEIRDIVFPDGAEALEAAQRRLWPVEVTVMAVDQTDQTFALGIGI